MGYVYIMSNPSLPKLIKLGKTKNLANRRQQLSRTSTPFPFNIEFSLESNCHDELEKKAKQYFARFRINKNREFFEIDVNTAKNGLIQIAKNLENGLKYLPQQTISDDELYCLESKWFSEYDV
ncbi:GIY-YIG nuclease family protein [Pseudomonas luteola]